MGIFSRNPRKIGEKRPYAGRVEYYARGRPSYAPAVVDLLEQEGFLCPGMVVADVGCGTGKLSRLFLEKEYTVYGIEPDEEMRRAASKLFRQYPDCRLINARAESTGLAKQSVDLVCAGTVIHWFDPRPAKKEFARILRKPGKMLIVDAGFDARSELTQFRIAANAFSKGDLAKRLLKSFKGHDYYLPSGISTVIRSEAQLSFEDVMAYVLSLINLPLPGQEGHSRMRSAVREVFDTLQVDGKVNVHFDCNVFYGTITGKRKQ